MTKYKTIFTLSIYLKLKQMGFEPILEKDNINKPGYKCWMYEYTPEFEVAFGLALKQIGSEGNGNAR